MGLTSILDRETTSTKITQTNTYKGLVRLDRRLIKETILKNEAGLSIKAIQSTTIMNKISTKGTIVISTKAQGRASTSTRTR